MKWQEFDCVSFIWLVFWQWGGAALWISQWAVGTELEEGAGGLVAGGVTVGAGQVGDAGIAGADVNFNLEVGRIEQKLLLLHNGEFVHKKYYFEKSRFFSLGKKLNSTYNMICWFY